jgi:pilus assembly protein CpaE
MGGRAAEPLRILCVSPDGSVAAGIKAMLASLPDFVLATRTARYPEATAQAKDLDLVFVVLDDDPTAGLDVIEGLRKAAIEAHFVVVGADDDPDLFVRAIRAGAHEHLTLPLSQHDLFKICTKVAETSRDEPRATRGGALWVVYGPKGGVGATTLVVNLAVSLAAAGRDVALVDLDVYAGDGAFFLNMHPTVTLGDVVANYGRLDGVFVGGAMTRHASGVSILAAPPGIGRGTVPVEPTSEQTIGILELVTAMHDLTLVNAPGIPSGTTRAVLLAADRILLVTDLSIPALRGCAATIEWLEGESVDVAGTVEVIVNRYDPRATELSVADISRRMRAPVRAVLPCDDAAAASAANAGLPIAEGSPLQRAIAELASPGAARGEASLLKRGLARLFSGRAA